MLFLWRRLGRRWRVRIGLVFVVVGIALSMASMAFTWGYVQEVHGLVIIIVGVVMAILGKRGDSSRRKL